jgi:hypothetical protein
MEAGLSYNGRDVKGLALPPPVLRKSSTTIMPCIGFTGWCLRPVNNELSVRKAGSGATYVFFIEELSYRQ